jgi:hypothetical protein
VEIIQWVKLESWHVLAPDKTLCGLDISDADEVRDELGTEKSCENCLRILARKTDLAHSEYAEALGIKPEA